MFRVDLYSHQGDSAKLLPPAYACLATADEDGRLLTVGRKNATFLLDKDKSVSRDHVHLHLLSPDHDGAATLSSAEEKDCCSKSPLGMALKVKNLGKFGTTILALAPVVQEQGEDDSKPTTAGGNDSSGSDTEDESQKPTKTNNDASSLPVDDNWFEKTQEIAQKLLQDKSHKVVQFEKLAAKESKPIPGNATTMILQCGQVGSLMVLTNMNLKICPSVWNKKSQEVSNQLYKIGADLIEADVVEETLLETFAQREKLKNVLETPLPPSTYLITTKRDISSPKQLVAWNLGFPFATLEFLEALLERKAPQDPWPNHQEFEPPFKMPPGKDMKNIPKDIWSTQGSPKLWRFCTFLSTSEKATVSVEHLVRAAGGKVVRVYDMEDDDAKKEIQKLWEDPNTKDGVFAQSTQKRPKIAKWIKDQGIPHLNQKKITLAFCEQGLLHDDKEDRVIQGKETKVEEEEPTKEEEPAPQEADLDSDATDYEEEDKPKEKKAATKAKSSKPQEEEAKSEEEEEAKPETKRGKRESQKAKPSKRKRGNDSDDDDDKPPETPAKRSKSRSQTRQSQDEEKSDEGQEPSPAKRSQSRSRKRQSRDEEEDDDEPEPSQAKRSRGSQSQRSMDIMPSVQEEDSMVLDDSAISEEPKRPKKRRNSESDDERQEKENKAEKKKKSKDRRRPAEQGTARLETTADGWLVSAPKDSASREAYVRPDALEEVKRNYEEQGMEHAVAATVACSGLVVRSYDPNLAISGTGVRHKKAGGKDFKRFRKNQVIMGPRSRIEMRAVQHTESLRLKQLEEEQVAIDAQQREADELFANAGRRQTKITKSTARSRRKT